MKRQFTATAYIIENQKTLLIFHKKLGKWLPPGGHIDPNELPTDAAVREAKEETGIDIELISDSPLLINEPNAVSIPRPYLCLVEEIPHFGDQEAHQHIDFVYLAKPIGGTLIDTHSARWFTLSEVKQLGGDIYNESVQTLQVLLA